MRRIFFVMVVLCLVCLSSAKAQANVSLNEAESQVVLQTNSADFSLTIENSSDAFNDRLKLELIDTEDKTRAQISPLLNIKKGKETYDLTMPLGNLTQVENELVWYRLRYHIGNSEGIISLSQLIENDFELRVAASEYVFSGSVYRVRVRAFQPYTNQPAANISIQGHVKLNLDSEAKKDELKLDANSETNAEGFAVLDFKIPEKTKFDDGDLKITGRKNGIIRDLSEDLDTSGNKGAVILSTDKPIYQPSQTFSIRGLYLGADQMVVPNSRIEFKIKDEDDTLLYHEEAKTSEFGIASISWKIPDNAKLGNYRVEVETDEDLREDQIHFKVSRYDLPNFTVAAKSDKTFYLPNEKQAAISVSADYLFGKPVTKGKVRIVQESERHWNYKEQKYETTEEQAMEGTTDADGKFTARANLSKSFKELLGSDWQRFDDLHFAAYFTDLTTNRTEQKRFDVRLTKEPIHIYLVRNYNENVNLPLTAYISTFYADGTPAVCNVGIVGKYEKSAEYKNLAEFKTNSFGAGKFKFTAPPKVNHSDEFELKIKARDGKGQLGTFTEDLSPDTDDAVKVETEKTIFKPGEAVRVSITSNEKNALVYLDVVKDWRVLDSYFIKLKDGKGELNIPYNPKFKEDLTLAAYTDEEMGYYNIVHASRGIIFPAAQNLKLDASFDSAAYKPNEEAKINFSVSDGTGKKIESALGVVVFDKAIEERARTDEEFGSYFSRFYGLLGYSKSFGGVTLKDLNELNLSKPVSADLQLAAEVMLADNYYYPHIYRTTDNGTTAKSAYAEYFKNQFAVIETALKDRYEKDSVYPTNEVSLKKILRESGIDFDSLHDPWGQNYYPVFSTERTHDILTFQTTGPDKKRDTNDFAVSNLSFDYFRPAGVKINQAVKNFHARTGKFIRDAATLHDELAKENFDFRLLKDRWNHDYRPTFEVSGRNYIIRFRSDGANGIYEPNYWNTDDFDVWTSPVDYFAETETKINEILDREVNRNKKAFPQNENEFRNLLKENDFELDQVHDGYGNSVYLTAAKKSRYADKTVFENGKQIITPITEEVMVFTIRTTNNTPLNFSDDSDLTEFSSILTEQSKDAGFSRADVRNVAVSGAKGAIRGTVYDAGGAVIPDAKVTATDDADQTKTYTAEVNENGEFLLGNLPSGKYTVKIDAANFKSAIYTNIQVRSQNIVEMKATLEVGAVSETVTVSSDEVLKVETSNSSATVNVTSSQIQELPKGKTVGNLLKIKKGNSVTQIEENSTPRLREYFPETLVWNPELLTDNNGRAELKFKLADNITTWKLYTIASTKSGKIGIAEKEIKAFQPFFADLEPPKILTVGDEIQLPVQVRNYTEKSQKVNVTMANGEWFSFLNSANQIIDVTPNNSQNAVFGFRAETPIKNGKQRVTVIADKDSDAIEKPVTVHPNGQEIVETNSKIFRDSARFDVNFPAETLPKTQRAELKIYPNLLSHVAESVTGLLERPYGCGEQTISSTYPNLMILKFGKTAAIDEKLKSQAQKFLQKGYERLLGYQQADGGFSIWTKDSSDAALTAYAIRFLNDAKDFIEVDDDVIANAQKWLLTQQKANGSWTRKYSWETTEDANRTKILTTYIARILALTEHRKNQKSKEAQNALQRSFGYLENKNQEIDEPFAMASFALALLDAGETEKAAPIIEKLQTMAKTESDSAYWNLETNTPFYGWGTAGRIETTALVVQALTGCKAQSAKCKAADQSSDELISKGTLFLLKNKDRYGVWYSTQATINVLDALLTQFESDKQTPTNRMAEIFADGKKVKDVQLPPSNVLANPLTIDLSETLEPSANKIEVRISRNDSAAMAQIVSDHYIDWQAAQADGKNTNQSRQLRLDYKCDKTNAAVMQEINCAVGAERVGFKGYGMLLAEIGLPPGAEVDRESLEKARNENWNFSRYDVLPDRIIVYLWASAGGAKFNFKFKPRYAISANTASSQVYDYYNPEAQATLAPMRFSVK